MKKRISIIFCVLAFTCLTLSACKASPSTSEGTETPPAQTLETIVITEPVRGYHWAPVYLAETLGYLAEEGLQADFQTVSGTDSSLPVFSGDAQFGLRGIEMALIANEAGNGCKVLASTTSHHVYQLIGANASYNSVESLRGGTIAGGQGPSSAPHAFAKAILLHNGITPDEETAVLSMRSSGYLAAMQAGEIQAAIATNPWSAKQLLDNGGVVIVDGTDPAAMEELMGSSNYELFVLFASDAYIAEHPETVQKLLNAVAKAFAFMNEATPEEIADALAPLFPDSYEEILYSAQEDKNAHIQSPDGFHTEEGFQAAVALTKLSGAVSKDHDAKEIFDESFLQKAWDAIPE